MPAGAFPARAVRPLPRSAPPAGRWVLQRRRWPVAPEPRPSRLGHRPPLLVRRRAGAGAGHDVRAARVPVPEAGAGAAGRGGEHGRPGGRRGRRGGGRGEAGAARGRRSPSSGRERRRRRPGQAPRPAQRAGEPAGAVLRRAGARGVVVRAGAGGRRGGGVHVPDGAGHGAALRQPAPRHPAQAQAPRRRRRRGEAVAAGRRGGGARRRGRRGGGGGDRGDGGQGGPAHEAGRGGARGAGVAAAPGPAGGLRGRAPGVALRPLPPPVPRRRREAEAGGGHRSEQKPDIELVHQRARAAVEADDRGDVQGRVLRGFRRLQGRRHQRRLLVVMIKLLLILKILAMGRRPSLFDWFCWMGTTALFLFTSMPAHVLLF